MQARSPMRHQRLIVTGTNFCVGALALASTFISETYSRSAPIVLTATALCMWSIFLFVYTQFSTLTIARAITTALTSTTLFTLVTGADASSQGIVLAFSTACLAASLSISALHDDSSFSMISYSVNCAVFMVALVASDIASQSPIVTFFALALVSAEYFVIRHSYVPVKDAFNDAHARAEIFSTITRSSREFHSREPEEAIRNIINVTKTLGYISVSVVSFDRRQKIFDDGVPIPGAMEVAVRASATRHVTIVQDENTAKKKHSRQGDVVGVPIWINGRYSAALIVQTSAHVKVTQRDCEALELLADQAGRALENAGKAAMDRRVVERLTDESQRDKLTGLGNRRFADSMVASMKPGDVLAMIDLDGLKGTNDVYGHAAGDELLHEVGVFLSQQIRNPDMAARLGGDEFMLLLRNAHESAPIILERLIVQWRAKKLYNTTFSIGMAEHASTRTARETVESADEALYKAKKQGKDRLITATAV